MAFQFFLIWLHPSDVNVLVHDFRIYPFPEQNAPIHPARLSIVFLERSYPLVPMWSLGLWKALETPEGLLNSTRISLDSGLSLPRKMITPIKTARSQIAEQFDSNIMVNAIGHIAGAMVVLLVENGKLFSRFDREPQFLRLCSPVFQTKYPHIMTWFGWDNLDGDCVSKILESLEVIFKLHQSEPDFDMVKMIYKANGDCFTEYGSKSMLWGKDDEEKHEVVQYTIHLCAEALYLSFCYNQPHQAVYRPLESAA